MRPDHRHELTDDAGTLDTMPDYLPRHPSRAQIRDVLAMVRTLQADIARWTAEHEHELQQALRRRDV